jgi:dTDP-4-dehydrorhamnose reductase
MNHARFLIVGASGFVGSHLYARLGAERSIATFHRKPIAGGVHFDAATMDIGSVLRDAPDVTCAFLVHGIGRLDECARDPAGTAKVNVEGMQRIIDELAARGIKIVFTSSDAVFDGSRGGWTEQDATNGCNQSDHGLRGAKGCG